MTKTTIYALGESQVAISDNGELSGYSQGDGSHLVGKTITLQSHSWETIEINDNDWDFDDNDSGQKLHGDQEFDGTSYSKHSLVEAEYRLTVEAPDGTCYKLVGFNINEGGGTSYATVEGLAFIDEGHGFPPAGTPLRVVHAEEGGSQAYSSLATPVCFTAGCRVLTPTGPVQVEDLRIGDSINTMDNGAQPIRWIGRCLLPAAALQQEPDLQPILVRKDSFGEGCPAYDIHLSPQHRVLIRGPKAQLFFGEPEILVPVKKMTDGRSILRDNTRRHVEYLHLLLDRHEVIWSDGLASESLYPEATTAKGCDSGKDAARIIPELAGIAGAAVSARPCISDKRTELIRQAA